LGAALVILCKFHQPVVEILDFERFSVAKHRLITFATPDDYRLVPPVHRLRIRRPPFVLAFVVTLVKQSSLVHCEAGTHSTALAAAIFLDGLGNSSMVRLVLCGRLASFLGIHQETPSHVSDSSNLGLQSCGFPGRTSSRGSAVPATHHSGHSGGSRFSRVAPASAVFANTVRCLLPDGGIGGIAGIGGMRSTFSFSQP